MATLFLRHDLALAWRGRDAFDAALAIEGETYRVAANRRTVRFDAAGATFFAKLHGGVGAREILKNLVTLKLPVLGARNEFDACRRLAAAGIPAPRVAAFGWRAVHPARGQSFIVCDALTNHVSLETLAERWAGQPPPPRLRRRMILAVADLARAMHDAGVNHRDFYLCHILADADALARGEARLTLIDLHRAQTRGSVPRRWRLRDLAALGFSAAGLRLSRADQLRFAARYAQLSPREALRQDGALWRGAGKRARRLRWRELKRHQGGRASAETQAGGTPETRPARRHEAAWAREPLALEGGEPHPAPFRVTAAFEDGTPTSIECEAVLRHVPGRRLVVRARLDGLDVAVKFFVGKGARRRCRREARGLQRLALALAGAEDGKGRAGFARFEEAAAPALVATGRCAHGHWCAAQWIAEARPATPADGDNLVAIIARLHEGGLLQQDPHPGNFVVASGRVYAVDGGAVQPRCRLAAPFRQTVAPRAGRANLARLLAALDVGNEGVERAWRSYCAMRELEPTPAMLRQTEAAVARATRRRVRRYLRKTRRRCTEFAVERRAQGTLICSRAAMGEGLKRLLEEPDPCMARGEPLKNGNTATVARVRIGGDAFIVKRYNAKGRRAARAWRNGHWLRLRGIPTARPLALLTRHGPGPAYLVLEDLGDERLDHRIARDGLDGATLQGVANLFAALGRERLTHRDAKASNFLVCRGAVALVDLDALRPFRSWREHRKDRQRFVRNWEGEVAARFADRLGVTP